MIPEFCNLQVSEAPPAEAVEEELAEGGDVEVASGAPAAHAAPTSEQGPVAPAGSGDDLGVAPRQLSGASAASWALAEAPSAESPLQHYAGRICEGGVCRYTARKHGPQEAQAPEASEAPLPQVTVKA